MNIVILNDNASVNGGAAKIALESAQTLAFAGHQVILICAVGPVALELQGQTNLTVHCMDIHEILTDPNRLRALAYGWWNPASAKFVGTLLDVLNPQETVVHVHNWSKALSASAVKMAIDRGFPVVFTLHDFHLACPTGTLFIHPTQQKCLLSPMSLECISTNCDVRSYPQKLWRVGRQAVQEHAARVPSTVKHFIYYSEMAYDILRPYLPQDANYYPLPNPVELPYQPPANISEHSTFTFLGRLAREKGVELFARAAAAESVSCRFIGEGLARDRIVQANPNAILPGWMNHQDGLSALRESRALVFPSLWYETLGLVVLEAAGNGVPAIVSDSCAARESVLDGVTGLHFRSGDQADLQAKIAILKDPLTAARMGKAAHERFWASSGSNATGQHKEVEKVYRRIIEIR